MQNPRKDATTEQVKQGKKQQIVKGQTKYQIRMNQDV